MEEQRQPRTLAQTAFLDRALGTALSSSPRTVYRAHLKLGGATRYFVYDLNREPFLLIATGLNRNRPAYPESDAYNTIVTVTSYCDKHNRFILDQIAKETSMRLNVHVSPLLTSVLSMDKHLERLQKDPDYLAKRWNACPLE